MMVVQKRSKASAPRLAWLAEMCEKFKKKSTQLHGHSVVAAPRHYTDMDVAVSVSRRAPAVTGTLLATRAEERCQASDRAKNAAPQRQAERGGARAWMRGEDEKAATKSAGVCKRRSGTACVGIGSGRGAVAHGPRVDLARRPTDTQHSKRRQTAASWCSRSSWGLRNATCARGTESEYGRERAD